MPPDPKVVFDCNIFVQAFLSASGPAASCVRLVESNVVTVLLSVEILAELRDVLNRPRLSRRFPAISQELVDEFLRRVLKNADVVKEVGRHFNYERDPKDEKYINLALDGAANYLISRDNDLLDLMKETDDGKEFRQRFPSLTILNPVAFLRKVETLREDQQHDAGGM